MGLQKVETMLDEWYKKLPQMPESARKGLAGNFWWIALVLGLLQLWGAWALWRLAHYLDAVNRAADYVNQYYGYHVVNNSLNFFYYFAVIVIIVDAAILLLAAPALKAWKKMGWNLLFYSLLLNLLYGLVRIFSDVGGGVGNLFWSVVTAAVAGYFIFQVRSYFVKGGGVDLKMSSTSTSDKSKTAK